MEWNKRLGNHQQLSSLATKMEEKLKIIFSSFGGPHGRQPRVRVNKFAKGM